MMKTANLKFLTVNPLVSYGFGSILVCCLLMILTLAIYLLLMFQTCEQDYLLMSEPTIIKKLRSTGLKHYPLIYILDLI